MCKDFDLSVYLVTHRELSLNRSLLDVIGLSPVFHTQTKRDIHTPLLLDGVSKIAAISKHPMVGIGGIHLDNVNQDKNRK